MTDDHTSSQVDRDSAGPAGTAYDWYHRAMALLAEGNPDAAALAWQHPGLDLEPALTRLAELAGTVSSETLEDHHAQ